MREHLPCPRAASGQAGLPLTRLDPDLRAAVDALCLSLPEMAKPLRELWLSGSLLRILDDPAVDSRGCGQQQCTMPIDREAWDRM